MHASKFIHIYFDGLNLGAAPSENIQPRNNSDSIDTRTLQKIKDYAQKVVDLFSKDPNAEEKFISLLDLYVSDITNNPSRVKLLLEKVSASDKLTDKQKTHAMLDIMENLSIQNPDLYIGAELATLRQKVISGEARAHAETFAKLHEMRNSLKSGTLKL